MTRKHLFVMNVVLYPLLVGVNLFSYSLSGSIFNAVGALLMAALGAAMAWLSWRRWRTGGDEG